MSLPAVQTTAGAAAAETDGGGAGKHDCCPAGEGHGGDLGGEQAHHGVERRPGGVGSTGSLSGAGKEFRDVRVRIFSIPTL